MYLTVHWSALNFPIKIDIHLTRKMYFAFADNSIMTSCVNAVDAAHETTYFCERLPVVFNRLATSMCQHYCHHL